MTTESEFSTNECESPVIDWSVLGVLEGLRKPGEPDSRIPLINIYLKFSSEIMKHIRTAFRTCDGQLLETSAHSLKSSSMSMGATGFGALCGELERIGRRNALPETGDLLHRAEEQYAAVTVALKEALQQMGK
jgi:HPt (histidine-containing phosphotransfer) domain-containing protein